MIDLKLSSKEQSFLADFCSFARGIKYKLETDGYVNDFKVKDGVIDLLLKYDFSPQELDTMYDRLHRTGSNF